MSRFSVELFLSRSIENFRRGALLRFTKSLVSKFFLEKRGKRSREGGNIKIFRPKFFVSMPKKFVRNPSVCH